VDDISNGLGVIVLTDRQTKSQTDITENNTTLAAQVVKTLDGRYELNHQIHRKRLRDQNLTRFDEDSTGKCIAAIGQRTVTARLQFTFRQRQTSLKLMTVVRMYQRVDAFTKQLGLHRDNNN